MGHDMQLHFLHFASAKVNSFFETTKFFNQLTYFFSIFFLFCPFLNIKSTDESFFTISENIILIYFNRSLIWFTMTTKFVF